MLEAGDILVLNKSAVEKRRIFCVDRDFGREFEVFLVEQIEVDEVCERWRALSKPRKRLLEGILLFSSSQLEVEVVELCSDSRFVEVLLRAPVGMALCQAISSSCLMPIPPYIRGGRSDERDDTDYQTVYAGVSGSLAAPTAGLHFSEALLSSLVEKGVEICNILLHVGLSSIERVPEGGGSVGMEYYEVSQEVAETLSSAKSAGRRVVAVGTTSVRTLETLYQSGFSQLSGYCELFIQPGYEFGVVDVLITNFHQPGSTHLQLVSAFVGGGKLEMAYGHALDSDYRFLSYGDACFFLRG